MHNITSNMFMDFTDNPLDDYSIKAFLYNDCATEKHADIEKIMLSVASILAMMRFNTRLLGNDYLIWLITRYIVKSDYSEKREIDKIAENRGTYPKVIKDNITAAIKYNPDFVKLLYIALPISVKLIGVPSITEVVEAVGTIYKRYYNYTVDSEELEDDSELMINYIEINFNGSKRDEYIQR